MFADGEAVRFDDAGAVPWAVDVPGDPVVEESMLAAPLMTQEGAIGVVVVSKVGIGQFGDDDLKVLKLVAALATVAVESARNQAEQREAAEVSEALLELAAALSLQSSVDGIARMVALALDRLMQCAGISVWLRDGDDLVPAALVGYTPREDERLMRLRLPASAEPLGPALLSRRVMVVNVDEAPVLAGCLDAAPAGTTFALIAVGERSANRGLIVVQRGPRRGPPAPRDERMLLGIADQALLAFANRALYDELETSFLATVEALGNALDLKDSYTNDHAQALVGMCTAVAERMGLPDADVRDVSFASALHDIGKIGIPLEILNKPARLTVEEFEVMKRHPELGGRIIAPVPALAGRAGAGCRLPRALRRLRLSAGPGRRGDSGRCADHPGVRRLPRDGVRPRVPQGDELAGGGGRAAALCRRAVRRRGGGLAGGGDLRDGGRRRGGAVTAPDVRRML